MWHTKLDLRGLAAGPLGEWFPMPSTVPEPEFVLSPWLGDDLLRTEIHCTVRWGMNQITLRANKSELLSSSPILQEWHFSHSTDGFHFDLWVPLYSGQDAADFSYCVHWSDPTDGSAALDDVTITLHAGEPLQIYMGKRYGCRRLSSTAIEVYQGKLPHGLPVSGRGVLLGTDQSGKTDPLSPERFLAQFREGCLIAALEGGVVSSTRWASGDWLAFGSIPAVNDLVDLAKWWAYTKQEVGRWGQREQASLVATGAPGAQWPFGASKGTMAVSGRPWAMLALLDGADDPRGWYHTELDGSPASISRRPTLQTWESLIELRMSPDTFGKDREQSLGWSKVGPREIGMDAQHIGVAADIAAFALTGDRMIEDKLLRLLTSWEMSAFLARWSQQNPLSWLDAPRADGRELGALADMLLLWKGETRDRIRALAKRHLERREFTYPKTGDVRWIWTMRDDRVLAIPGQAGMPWMDALGAMGYLKFGCALTKIGETALAQRFMDYAIKVGRNVIEYGFADNTITGKLMPITGIKVNPDGSPQDAAYYQFPRANAGTEPLPGYDMMVADDYWFSWFSGAMAATLFGPKDSVWLRAKTLWDTWSNAGDLAWREWFAIEVPAE